MEIREGYMPFKGYKTYYRIVGKKTGDKKPLVLLHGGPGSTHNYFEVLDRLAEEDGRELVMYDQIGCGESYVENRPDLWTAETWIEELKALREHLGLDESSKVLLFSTEGDTDPERYESIVWGGNDR